MPQGVDPDELLLEKGAEAFQGVLDAAVDALSYKWKQLVREFNASGGDLTGQQKAVATYLDMLASARGAGPVDALRWGSALARVSRLTEIPVDELNRRFRIKKNSTPRKAAAPETTGEAPSTAPLPPKRLTAQDRAERWILGVLLLHPQRWHDVQQVVHLDDFVDDGHKRLAEIYWNHQRDEGEPVFNEFLGSLREPDLTEIAKLAVDAVETLPGPVEDILSEALAYLERQRRARDEQKLVAASRRTPDSLSGADEIALLKELTESRRRPELHRTPMK